MIKIYVEQEALQDDTGEIIEGAMAYTKKLAQDVMTSIDDVFMLSKDEKLNFKLMMTIFERGMVPVEEFFIRAFFRSSFRSIFSNFLIFPNLDRKDTLASLCAAPTATILSDCCTRRI